MTPTKAKPLRPGFRRSRLDELLLTARVSLEEALVGFLVIGSYGLVDDARLMITLIKKMQTKRQGGM